MGTAPEMLQSMARVTVTGCAGLIVLLSGAIVAAGSGVKASPASTHPSILLVTVDTLRADHLEVYGYDRPTAPHLTSLARDATVWSRAYSTSSWTVPSVTSLLTGVYPATHGTIHGVIRGNHVFEQEIIPEDLPRLAEALKAAGYTTFGVTANTHLDREHGWPGVRVATLLRSSLPVPPAPAVVTAVRRQPHPTRAQHDPGTQANLAQGSS